MDRQKQMREYLNKRINPVFERLIVDLLIDMPNDFVTFATDWLQSKGRQMADGQEINENAGQNGDIPSKDNGKQEKTDYRPPSSDEDEDDEEDDVVDDVELEKKVAKMNKGQRSSISAEAYGNFNKKEDFKAKVIEKSEEAKQRIKAKMSEAFMFSVLNEEEINIVVGAMEECKFEAGDYVIKQGENGEILYVIEEGELDCFKKFSKDQAEPTYLKTYVPGEAFGELALLYNAPRAATIKAKTDSILWSLDRECFNVIVKDATRRKREKHEDILEKVKIFDHLDPYERSRLGDVTKDKVIAHENEVLFKEGEEQDCFYILADGQVDISASNGESKTLKSIDYFGESGLLYNAKSQYTAQTKTHVCTLIYIEKGAFGRLLMPLFEQFKKEESKYLPVADASTLHK